jgi:hypothetical protein
MPADSHQPPPQRRVLRLSTILADLGTDAVVQDTGRSPWRRRPRPRTNITIGEIVDRTRQSGFGFLAAVLALIAVPFVGLSTPFGLATAFLGVQMIAGRSHPWLPKKLRGHRVSLSTLNWLSHRVARLTSGLERIIRPRFPLLLAGPFWSACGVGILLQGLGLALPLPIPGSNWIFIVPVILYGIGLLEADGVLLMVCHCITLGQLAMGVWLWETIWPALLRSFQWLGSWLG